MFAFLFIYLKTVSTLQRKSSSMFVRNFCQF